MALAYNRTRVFVLESERLLGLNIARLGHKSTLRCIMPVSYVLQRDVCIPRRKFPAFY